MSKSFELGASFDNNQSRCCRPAEEESNVDDSDNECPPPPPPFCSSSSLQCHHSTSPLTPLSSSKSPLPSPPPSSPQSTTNNESCDKLSSKECQEEIAIRFHQYVLRLKCICGWNECMVQRKQTIASKKQLLKRILFKWVGHLEDVRSRRNSMTKLSKMLHIVERQAVQHGMEILYNHCMNSKIVERVFLSWHDFAIKANHNRMSKECHAVNELSLSKTRLYFQTWRKITIVNTMVECKTHTLLSNILKYWHHMTKESSLDWIKKMEHVTALIDVGRLEMLGKIFKCLVSEYRLRHILLLFIFYTCSSLLNIYISLYYILIKRFYTFKKKKFRSALYQFAFKRAERIMRISIQSWKQNHRLVKQMHKVIINIMKRQTFATWRVIVSRFKRQEYISVQIIFNRWKCIAEERTYKREKTLFALNHRVRYLYKQVLISWKAITIDAKGRLRTPSCLPIHRTRSTFSSDHCLNTAHYIRRLPSHVRKASTLPRRHSTSTLGCPFGSKHLHRSKCMQHNIRRSHDPISRRLNFFTHDSNIKSRSSIYSTGIPTHQICPQSNISYLELNSKFKPISFNHLDRISQTNSLGNQRPLEHLMDGRVVGSGRKLSVPPWILNNLSNREAKNDWLQSIANKKEIFNVPAEPKYSSDELFSSVKPSVKKSRNDNFRLSKGLSYSNEGKEMLHK
jgi:hypothetical protein